MKRAVLMALLCVACTCAAAADRPLRDPFARPAPPPAPAAAPETPPPPLQVRAIIVGGTRSLANIDGAIVAAGDETADYKVLRIDARGVLVARAGRQQLLLIQEKDKQ
jgi:hypothetical protein